MPQTLSRPRFQTVVATMIDLKMQDLMRKRIEELTGKPFDQLLTDQFTNAVVNPNNRRRPHTTLDAVGIPTDSKVGKATVAQTLPGNRPNGGGE